MFNIESRHLLELSFQNALDCISENFNLENFHGGACTWTSLEKCAPCSPDGRYCAHNATVYYISRPPLSKNPLSAPGAPCYKVGNRICQTELGHKRGFSFTFLFILRSLDKYNLLFIRHQIAFKYSISIEFQRDRRIGPDNIIKTSKCLTVYIYVSKYNCSIYVAILLPFIFKEGKGLH